MIHVETGVGYCGSTHVIHVETGVGYCGSYCVIDQRSVLFVSIVPAIYYFGLCYYYYYLCTDVCNTLLHTHDVFLYIFTYYVCINFT